MLTKKKRRKDPNKIRNERKKSQLISQRYKKNHENTMNNYTPKNWMF